MILEVRSGALAVVLRGRRALLVRRRNPPDAGLWGYPGGHVELGETVGAAAMRELAEETSVVARATREIDTFEVVRCDADGAIALRYHLTAILCTYVSGEPLAADDVSDAAWIAQADVAAGRLSMSERTADILRLALRATRR